MGGTCTKDASSLESSTVSFSEPLTVTALITHHRGLANAAILARCDAKNRVEDWLHSVPQASISKRLNPKAPYIECNIQDACLASTSADDEFGCDMQSIADSNSGVRPFRRQSVLPEAA